MAITAFYNRIDKYIVHAKLRQPLHVGSAESGTGEILIHPIHGMPFVQASGIAGVFRSCYEELFRNQNQAMELFGDNEKTEGRIRFTDARILGDSDGLLIEVRPRIHINPVTGTSASAKGKGADSSSGQKFEMEYLGAGQEIEFRVYLYSQQSSEEKEIPDQKRIEQVFAQIHNGQLQFGGQKSNGCGSMLLLSLRHHAFNLCTEIGRSEWIREDEEEAISFEELLESIEKISINNDNSPRAYTITLDAKTEGSLLVKSIALTEAAVRGFSENNEKEPDYVNMKNVQDQYIVPGSSLKGALRSQFERIADYMDRTIPSFESDRVTADAFGRAGKKKDTGASGNIRVFDTIICPSEGCEQEIISNRIRIDRFTGGVINSSLFKEQPVHGRLQIEVAVMKNRSADDPDKAERSCGMMILTLRDLAFGMFNLGSGYSIGRGFLTADKMRILRSDGATAEITFDESPAGSGHIKAVITDTDGVIDSCMQSLLTASVSDAGKEGV